MVNEIITPEEKSELILNKFIEIITQTPVKKGSSIAVEEYMTAKECAEACVDFIYDFMKDDDDLHECGHFANSRWVDYYVKVKKSL
jgi:hypothetical protein